MSNDGNSVKNNENSPAADAARVDPQAMTAGQVAKILSAAGGRRITADAVRATIEAGAPVLPDGRVNLVDLMAWMERELAK